MDRGPLVYDKNFNKPDGGGDILHTRYDCEFVVCVT